MIIVASVSCIYGLGDPEDYSELVLSLRLGQTKSRDEILSKLVDIQYTRNDMNFIRGTFRVQGDTIEIFPAAYSEKSHSGGTLRRRNRSPCRGRCFNW